MNALHITEAQANAVVDAGFAALQARGFKVTQSDLAAGDMMAVFNAMAEACVTTAPAVPSGWRLEDIGPQIHIYAPDGKWAAVRPDADSPARTHIYQLLRAMLTAAPTPPAKPANIGADQRARFERWATNDGAWPDNIARSAEEPDKYANHYIQEAWMAVQAASPTPAQPAVPDSADDEAPVQLGELAKRNVYDAIRGAYDLGYNDARNARAVPGDSAPGYEGRNVEADHGGALFNSLNQRLRRATATPAVPEDVARAGSALANIAFNLSQCAGQTIDAGMCLSMDTARKRWDAAIDAARAAGGSA